MCLGGKTPSAPVNAPAYAPEDEHKYFQTTMTDESGKVTDLKKANTETPRTSVPSVKPKQEQIRM